MSVQELQRAATGPWRWERVLQTKGVPHARLPEAKPLDPIILKKWDMLLSNGYVHLVPGGRFMFTVHIQHGKTAPQSGITSESSATIALWDMGSPGDASFTEPARVANCKVNSEVFDRMQLRIVMEVSVMGETSLRIAVGYPRPCSQRTRCVTSEAPV
jgi:hypothetical protein